MYIRDKFPNDLLHIDRIKGTIVIKETIKNEVQKFIQDVMIKNSLFS
jgi:hypothetical protein